MQRPWDVGTKRRKSLAVDDLGSAIFQAQCPSGRKDVLPFIDETKFLYRILLEDLLHGGIEILSNGVNHGRPSSLYRVVLLAGMLKQKALHMTSLRKLGHEPINMPGGWRAESDHILPRS